MSKVKRASLFIVIILSFVLGYVTPRLAPVSSQDTPQAAERVITYYNSSGLQDADGAIKASAGRLGGVLILTDGTNDVTLILYDDPDSADGTELFKAKVAGGDNYGGVMFPLSILFSKGCWADVEGTGPEYIVYHR